MARGWESKAVEAQQQDRSNVTKPSRALSADERRALERRRTLELARARTEADLRAATSARHRAMLEDALAALDERIRGL